MVERRNKRIYEGKGREGLCSTYFVDQWYPNFKIQLCLLKAIHRNSVMKIQQCSDSTALAPDTKWLIIYTEIEDILFSPDTPPFSKHFMYDSSLSQLISSLSLHLCLSCLIFLIHTDISEKGPSKLQQFIHCLPLLITH